MKFFERQRAWADAERKAAYSPRVDQLYYDDVAVSTFVDPAKAIKDGYEACSWAFMCVRRKQDMVASLNRWLVRTYDKDGNHTDNYDHPAAKVISCPSDRWPYYYNMYRAAGFLSVTGRVYFGLMGSGVSENEFDREKFLRASGRTMKVESPEGISPVRGSRGWVKYYKLDPPRDGVKSWSVPSTIQVMQPGLAPDGLEGQSDFQGLARTIDGDVAAKQWNLNTLSGGGTPTTMMVDYTQSEDTLEKNRAAIDDRFLNAGKKMTPYIIPGKGMMGPNMGNRAAIELHKLGMTAQELDWLGGAGLARDEIVSGLGFHPSEFAPEETTKDTARVARTQAWERGAFPLLRCFSAWFSVKFLSREERESGSMLIPDLRDVGELYDSKDSIATAFAKLNSPGGLSVVDSAKNTGIAISNRPEYEIPPPPAQQARGDAPREPLKTEEE